MGIISYFVNRSREKKLQKLEGDIKEYILGDPASKERRAPKEDKKNLDAIVFQHLEQDLPKPDLVRRAKEIARRYFDFSEGDDYSPLKALIAFNPEYRRQLLQRINLVEELREY